MRDIIFRAKVKRPAKPILGEILPDGTWVYGELHATSRVPHIHDTPFSKQPIDPETVGQYIGVKDKDGNKIFEGDIIESHSLSGDIARHRIGFDGSMGCYIAILLIGQQAGYFFQLGQNWLIGYGKMVTGNVYDNPELLKGGEE